MEKFSCERIVTAFAAAVVVVALQNEAVSQAVYEEYTFTHWAGFPEAGPGYFDGLGRQAHFNAPAGLARDSSGNFYVADMNNHTIRKITAGGVVTTVAGVAGAFGSADGIGAAARFAVPQDVAVDSSGNLFVADSYNHTIR